MTSVNNENRIPAFTAAGLPVLIGSVPLADHRRALEWIVDATPEIPLWPQLPINPLERMLPQFCEGFPCLVEPAAADEGKRLFFDVTAPEFESEQLAFFEDYLRVSEDFAALDNSRFAVGRDRAGGLFLFCERLADLPGLIAVKGQITGPFTMLTGITDRRERLGYYDPAIRDMVVKGLAMKAAWQVRLLAAHTTKPVLLFIDEPALAGLGSSAFISVSLDDLRRDLSEIIEAIHRAGGLAGIHVCANTDWELLLGMDPDILSFDAYGYFDRLAPLRSQVHAYLDRGGIIAWGIVPTSREEEIMGESAASLVDRWEEQADTLTDDSRDRSALLAQTLITPSCGTGSLTPDLARRVLELTREVSMLLREKYLEKGAASPGL